MKDKKSENENTAVEMENDPKGALLSKTQADQMEPILGLTNFNAVQPQHKMDVIPFARPPLTESEHAQVKHPTNGMIYQINSHFLATVLDRYGTQKVISKLLFRSLYLFLGAISCGFKGNPDQSAKVLRSALTRIHD